MTQISVEEIKRDLRVYLHRVEAGETLVIEDAGKPVAEMRPFTHHISKVRSNNLRPIGLCEGKFVVPDNFNEPLPESVIEEFEG